MHSPDVSEVDFRDPNIDYHSIFKIGQNQSIMNLIPRKFREMKSTESQSSLSIKVSYKNRVTMRTTYGDLSFSHQHLGHTEYLCDRLFLPRRNQKPKKTIPENSSLKDDREDRSLNAHHFKIEKKSPPFVLDGDVFNSPRIDPEDHFVHEEANVLENFVLEFSNSAEEHGAFEKHLPDVRKDERKYSSNNRERSAPDNLHSSPNSPVLDGTYYPDVGPNERETENDFENIHNFSKKKAYSFLGHDFSDEFLSPFEFNVESRRNYIADEFTPMRNDILRKNRSPLPATPVINDFEMNEKFLDESFELEDCTQSVEDDLPHKYIDHVSDANDELSNSIRPESSVSRNADRRRDSIFDPVQDQYRDDSNSFHIQFSPTTTDVYSQENILQEQPDAAPEMSSPSVIEATPFHKNVDYPWEKYHRKSQTVSCLFPHRSEVDIMIKNGDEVHFVGAPTKEHEYVNHEEDMNDGVEVSPPISFKESLDLIPFVSYIHNGKLIMEDFSG